MEEWRAIIGHDGYEVSNLGSVRSPRGVLKLQNGKDGYKIVRLGAVNPRPVARLIAEAFIPNPEGKPEVDHIDRQKTNNVVSNLRWATRKEQLENREFVKVARSGEKHIYAYPNTFQVQVRRDYKIVFDKSFKTLAEAVVARDAFLNRAAVLAAVEHGHPEVVSH